MVSCSTREGLCNCAIVQLCYCQMQLSARCNCTIAQFGNCIQMYIANGRPAAESLVCSRARVKQWMRCNGQAEPRVWPCVRTAVGQAEPRVAMRVHSSGQAEPARVQLCACTAVDSLSRFVCGCARAMQWTGLDRLSLV